MKAINIKWDVDYDDNGPLPKSVDIPEEIATIDSDYYEAEEKISEWLSDTYGFCHEGFRIDMTEEERKEYCKNCSRSIYSKTAIGRSCDMNIGDNGYYNHANWPCWTKVKRSKV